MLFHSLLSIEESTTKLEARIKQNEKEYLGSFSFLPSYDDEGIHCKH